MQIAFMQGICDVFFWFILEIRTENLCQQKYSYFGTYLNMCRIITLTSDHPVET